MQRRARIGWVSCLIWGAPTSDLEHCICLWVYVLAVFLSFVSSLFEFSFTDPVETLLFMLRQTSRSRCTTLFFKRGVVRSHRRGSPAAARSTTDHYYVFIIVLKECSYVNKLGTITLQCLRQFWPLCRFAPNSSLPYNYAILGAAGLLGRGQAGSVIRSSTGFSYPWVVWSYC